MDERTTMLALMALLLVGGVALLGALYYLLRPKKKKAAPTKTKTAPSSKPSVVVGKVKLTKRERMSRSIDTLDVAARWGKTLYGPGGKPTAGSYAALFRAKGEKHRAAITAQVKRWLAEG